MRGIHRFVQTFAVALALAVSAFAQGGAYYHDSAVTLVNGVLAPIPQALVRACPAISGCAAGTFAAVPACVSPATLYGNAALTASLGSAMHADPGGNFAFWVSAAGPYDLQIVAPGGAGYVQCAVPLLASNPVGTSLPGVTSDGANGMAVAGKVAVGATAPSAAPSGTVAAIMMYSPTGPINVMAFGAKCDGATDDSTALALAVASQTSGQMQSLVWPKATCTFSTGLAHAGTLQWEGSGTGSILQYTGSGTAITLTGSPAGQINNLVLISSGSAAIGIDATGLTQFESHGLYIGGSPSTAFGVGVRLRGSSGEFYNFTSSWNPVGVLLDYYSGINNGILFENGTFWEESTAAFELLDVEGLTVRNSWFEAVQDAILITNPSFANILNVKIKENVASLQTTYSPPSPIFTNPQFLHVNAVGSANQLILKGLQVSGNILNSSGGSYCNILTRAGGLANSLDPWIVEFDNNNWSNCTAAAIYADNSVTNIIANQETYTGLALTAGSPTVFSETVDTGGTKHFNGNLAVGGSTSLQSLSYASAASSDGLSGYGTIQNLLLYSSAFSTSPWTGGNKTITANSVSSPFGVATSASTLTESSDSTAQYHFIYQPVTVSSGLYTQSIYAKTNGDNLYIANGSGGAYFDLTNGVVQFVSAGYSATISNTGLAAGWYRCALTFTPGSGSQNFYYYLANLSFTDDYIGGGTNGVYLWGASLNPGNVAFPYAGTTSAAFGPITASSTPALVINAATPITSQSSANSQVVTCPPEGSTTQVCDAAGNWIHTVLATPAPPNYVMATDPSGSTSDPPSLRALVSADLPSSIAANTSGSAASISATAAPNYVMATAPTGSTAAAPTLRALVSADIPANAANTSGTASNLSGTPALPSGTTATTQAVNDNSTKLATTAYADRQQSIQYAVNSANPTANTTYYFGAGLSSGFTTDLVPAFTFAKACALVYVQFCQYVSGTLDTAADVATLKIISGGNNVGFGTAMADTAVTLALNSHSNCGTATPADNLSEATPYVVQVAMPVSFGTSPTGIYYSAQLVCK
jgi:hypothetical protein